MTDLVCSFRFIAHASVELLMLTLPFLRKEQSIFYRNIYVR